jgi:hypothetical protein
MLRSPQITPRSARFLIAVLLAVKLALLVWNAVVFDGTTYDTGHHSDRALFGGMRPGKMAYNGPVYYFPAKLLKRPENVPLVERSSETIGDDPEAVRSRQERETRSTRAERRFRAQLLEVLRYSNIFWVGAFYIGWICYALPRLLRDYRAHFLAALLLLAMPGYQKLGVMSHPDNMFAGMAALAVCGWLFLRERWLSAQASGAPEPRYGFLHLLGFAFVIGLTALTRPFAVVPVAVFSIVLLVYSWRRYGSDFKRLLPRAALLITLVGVMSTGWYVYRWRASGEVTNAYRTGYIARFEARRANFDYVSYFTKLNLRDLISDPSRRMEKGGDSVYADTPLANSFFTLLYSEVWGDQWLYFSGPRMRDYKVWPKRVILSVALLVPVIVIGLGGTFLWHLAVRARALALSAPPPWWQRLRSMLRELEPELVLLSLAGLGAALFVYWQAGPALLPGKNSTVKFIYIASLFPPAIALLFRRPLPALIFNLLSAYFLILYIAAFPIAMYWPKE